MVTFYVLVMVQNSISIR